MKHEGYEEVKHTADLALRVWAVDFQELLSQSAAGMYALVGLRPQTEQPIARKLILPTANREEILVDFLNELLFLLEESHQFFNQFAFFDEDTQLRIEMSGYHVFSYNRQIKAVTFHNLRIRENLEGLETTITFDV